MPDRYGDDHDRLADALEREHAITECHLCDDHGYRGAFVCDHTDHQAAAKRGMEHGSPADGMAIVSDQLYLDGFRDGLGAAIRHLDAVRAMASHPCVHHLLAGAAPKATVPDVVAATLHSAATALRMLSASARLDDEGV